MVEDNERTDVSQKPMIRAKDTILFQGDSITDCGRARENIPVNAGLGVGYANTIAAQLLATRPAEGLTFLNRGISGNRIVDLYGRIKCDAINLKPDVLSVLIGVNDTWHEFGSQNGVDVPKYERVYRDFLKEVREALPGVRFVLCEPFVLSCGVVTKDWVAEMDRRRAVVKKLAAEFTAVFVPFQGMFDAAVKEAPPEYWARDGVHPTIAGHYRMAQAWLAATGA
jgi:lysophospholipase L1-like esterase